MLRTYAVRYDPLDGSQETFIIEAERSGEAKQLVLEHLHRQDLDAITIQDLSVLEMGRPAAFVFINRSDAEAFDIIVRSMEVK